MNRAGALIDAKVVSVVYSGQPLNNRMLEDQLTVGAQYLSVGKITRTNRSKPDEPALVDDGFDLVNVFATGAPTATPNSISASTWRRGAAGLMAG
ncbi:hypothetical protein NKJ72_01195 [Mesorhizobium sp. M0045]|uniref:hypothetical protein n=1 Tax=unclassified Mesorhizobium TaxID=325217 RepID=UPI00333A99DB